MTEPSISITPPPPGHTPFTELCLAGACNRGICYIGCLKKLEEENLLNIKALSASSIGAFIGICYILGFTSDELLAIIIDKDFKIFRDFSFSEEGAVLKGQEYKNWVFEILSKKINPNITLLDLYNITKIHFTCTTTCIYSNSENFKEGIIYMSHIQTPTVSLITAINCSMAFPFIFPPIYYQDCQFIDGGVLDNFPINLLSDTALGLKVNFKMIDGSTSIRNPISYIGKIFELITHRFKYLKPDTSKNIVCTECDDFNIIDFELSIDDKITLFKRGYSSMETFLKAT
jgi:predicted acylesterase/phospholipase RssA